MLSQPIALPLFKSCSDLIAVNQFAALGSGIAVFNLGAISSEPGFMLPEQFQSPLKHFVRAVIGPRAEHFSDELLLFWPQRDGHT